MEQRSSPYIYVSFLVAVSFYDTASVQAQVEWVPNKHYSGIFGLMKLMLPNVLPKNLTKVSKATQICDL